MFRNLKLSLATAFLGLMLLASACSQTNSGSRTYVDATAESSPGGGEANVDKQGGEAPEVITGTNLVFDFENFAATCAPVSGGAKPTSARCVPANRQGLKIVIPDQYPAKFSFKWTVSENFKDAVLCKGLEDKDLECDFVKPLSKPFTVELEAYQFGVPSGHPQTSFPLPGTGPDGSQGGGGSYLIVLSDDFAGLAFGPGGTGRQACADTSIMLSVAQTWGGRDATQLRSAPLLNFDLNDSTSLSYKLLRNGEIQDGPAYTFINHGSNGIVVESMGVSLREFWVPPADLRSGQRSLTYGVSYRWNKSAPGLSPNIFTGMYSGGEFVGEGNCSNWTDASPGQEAGVGIRGNTMGGQWLDLTKTACHENHPIYCVFW